MREIMFFFVRVSGIRLKRRSGMQGIMALAFSVTLERAASTVEEKATSGCWDSHWTERNTKFS